MTNREIEQELLPRGSKLLERGDNIIIARVPWNGGDYYLVGKVVLDKDRMFDGIQVIFKIPVSDENVHLK